MMLASAALLTLTHPLVAAAPQSAVATDGSPYWAVVTGNAVNLRSGPSAQSAYAFGKLKQGDLVRVVKEEYGWARVQTEGNAFADVTAFVPADRRVTLAADGTTATVNSRTELRAPNVDAGNSPDKSWKQIGNADAGSTLTVVGTADGEKESVYKVKVPATAEAWVNLQFLRRANANEAANATVTAPVTANANVAAAEAPTAPATVATETPANAPASGSAAPAAATADLGSSANGTTGGSVESLSSPAIPPLLGEKPQNASVTESVALESTTTQPKATKPKFVSKRATLDDLEHQFKAVRDQPQADAEFEALKAKYEELASTTAGSGGVKGMADARSKQLSLLVETQRQMQELRRTKTTTDDNRKGIADLILNIQRRAEYTAIGVLNASAVYDGDRLPELYRICDPTTGATIAYVEPNADIPMATMVGTLVGVKGGKTVDPALRLTVISPMAVELLTMRNEPQVVKTESTRPVEEAGKFVPAPKTSESDPAAPCPEGFEPAPSATP
jgi:SH3-like domain-containing protein